MRGPPKTDKWLPVLFILISDGCAIALLYLHLSGWRGPPDKAKWITQNRSTVGIAVQLISHALGIAMVQTLCAVVNLSTRVVLAGNGISLNTLRLANTICGMRVDWSLGWKQILIVLF